MSSSPFNIEQQVLSNVLPQIHKQVKKLKKIPRYYGSDFVEQALDHQRQSDLKKLEIALQEPYFGRLDFQETSASSPTILYIGKVGVSSEDSTTLLVIDWRAPISSMFYSFTGQDEFAAYQSPEGEVCGTIHLKRNISIRQQVLQRVVDSYKRGEVNLGAADEFLLHRLDENKDNRLRDIVSTIQVEQDQIIRAELDKVLIIQGVPGSGKTTVALHRLAFLLYQYKNSLTPERMIIFAPNRMFLDYISSVLPELGVDHIQQTTFTSWAMEILKEENILLPSSTYDVSANTEGSTKYKGSEQYTRLLLSALERYEKEAIPTKGFFPWERAEISKQELRIWFLEEYKHYPLAKRKERIMTRMKRWIETEYKDLRDLDSQGKMKKKAFNRLRSYGKSWSGMSLIDLYCHLIVKSIPYAEDEAQTLKAYHSKLKRKEVETEDIAPLLYIHHYINGVSSQSMFEHVVIDEAQDFSPFQIIVLKEFARNSSFTILGDLLQNIYHRGIDSWEEFQRLFEPESVQYHQLDISYRSTEEIINFANAIVSPYKGDVSLAKPIYRSGNPVQVLKTDDLLTVGYTVNQLRKTNINTIAIVTRDEEDSEKVYTFLCGQNLEVHLVTSSQTEYYGGITVTSISQVKGMEFDAVLLLDVDEENYPVSDLNAKLLYVGCTRALHHLYIFYSSQPSQLIEESIS